ncbi:hypothetical protein CN556_14885 [Bacillus wiedmannii]|uniref:HGGxSTG domain-containing protein n=1 Tax=Bacillus TaxID=1386 RepID=UPI000BECA680|nr:HGGxSTG domain-containing protein [Bacillus wiedmannii]MED2882182.1 HGGxSTG domain-containing protein [Bacillus wiedmannii]PEC63343.1 hypothetical protein CON91_05745 [Bacillus wiedmannii]PEI38164.1 hypothetical protein CN644_02745 [Bacillus wiedmannii]PEL97090.1 hypothetical protein CN604_20765 [Bacillus wiedmannii]PEN95363.1 hypothetical protein CN556_14885 [Bacillus wiedmannii]
MSKPKELPNGLREYINNVRDRLISGDLKRDSEEMVTIKEKLQKEESVCGAICGSGRVCTQPPTNEKNFRCRMHGGRSTGAKTEEGKQVRDANLKKGHERITHGLYMKDFLSSLTEEEIVWYNENMEWYQENYDLDPLDVTKLDLALINFIKSWRKNLNMKYAINEGVSKVDFENRAIKLLDDLGLSRKFRKSKENASNPTQINYLALFDGMDSN